MEEARKKRTKKKREKLYITYFSNAAKDPNVSKKDLFRQLNLILTHAWGDFPTAFVKDHVLHSEQLMIAFLKKNDEPVGFCSMRKRRIAGMTVHYIEFLVVVYAYQTQGIGLKLSRSMIMRVLFRNIPALFFGGVHLVFVTPNLRVLARSMEVADTIYPDPRLADADGRIPEADDTVWNIAQEVLRTSQAPNRILHREGLVLEGSYVDTPWLVYSNNDIPWHYDPKLNDFARRYLGYGKREDKEWIVYMRITALSFARYMCVELRKKLFGKRAG